MTAHIYIGTSGWHYSDWSELFYPAEITGYNELKFYSERFETVENNSSFYRISGESTYKTWDRMTPDDFKFSMKLNRTITHYQRLEVNEETRETVHRIIDTTQVLGYKLGAMLIQLPASFRYDLEKLDAFLEFFVAEVRSHKHMFDIAIEFRNKYWFADETYQLLRRHNVALVAGQSSRYPLMRHVTADVAYIRMHGPDKLFASSYTTDQLTEWAEYIKSIASDTDRIYVYFNNDFHGYALKNAQELQRLLGIEVR